MHPWEQLERDVESERSKHREQRKRWRNLSLVFAVSLPAPVSFVLAARERDHVTPSPYQIRLQGPVTGWAADAGMSTCTCTVENNGMVRTWCYR